MSRPLSTPGFRSLSSRPTRSCSGKRCRPSRRPRRTPRARRWCTCQRTGRPEWPRSCRQRNLKSIGNAEAGARCQCHGPAGQYGHRCHRRREACAVPLQGGERPGAHRVLLLFLHRRWCGEREPAAGPGDTSTSVARPIRDSSTKPARSCHATSRGRLTAGRLGDQSTSVGSPGTLQFSSSRRRMGDRSSLLCVTEKPLIFRNSGPISRRSCLSIR